MNITQSSSRSSARLFSFRENAGRQQLLPFSPAAVRPPESRVSSALVFLGLLALGLGSVSAEAQHGPGDLLVAPTRIVFEGRQRSAEITLVNTGSSTATYRITFVHLRMNEEGGTKEIEASEAEPGERFADELIRYSPRQVTLAPNVAQTVRMQLRKPAQLDPGEYRSHLLFRAVPSAEPSGTADPSTEFSVQLTAVFGVSIPVIVRHGEMWAKTTLSELEVAPPSGPDALPILHFRISRTGNQSIYGNLGVTFVPAGGKPSVVGLANGVAVYATNPSRVVGVPLRMPPGGVLHNGVLHVTYNKQEKGNETIARADLVVP